MKYMRVYGKWIVFIVAIWVYVIVDQTYDMKKIPEEFVVMDPAVKPEKYTWIRGISSMKDLKKGRSVVQFKYHILWTEGDERKAKNVYLYSRVVGVEGDTVEIKKGQIYVNGDGMDIPQAQKVAEDDTLAPVLVPRGYIYVINDHRLTPQSYAWDSRMLGPIHYSLVVGVVD